MDRLSALESCFGFLAFGSFASGCDPLPDPHGGRRTVTPSRARELAELQDENARLRAEAMNREANGTRTHSGLTSRLKRLQTLCRPVGHAVANVSLGRAVVCPGWRLIRCVSCRPSNRAVCGLPLVRLPSPGPVCPGAGIGARPGQAPCLWHLSRPLPVAGPSRPPATGGAVPLFLVRWFPLIHR